jgi:hypothetical protein
MPDDTTIPAAIRDEIHLSLDELAVVCKNMDHKLLLERKRLMLA